MPRPRSARKTGPRESFGLYWHAMKPTSAPHAAAVVPSAAFPFRRALWASATFVTVLAGHLATFTPTVWHPDSLNYVSNGTGWARGEKGLPTHTATYVGWEASIGALPAARSERPDALELVIEAKMLGLLFVAAAALGVHLGARSIFGSDAFGFALAALFAWNPYVWLWGHGAMSDLPALAFMLFSFLFFARYARGAGARDAALASGTLAVATVYRLQSLVLLAPYLLVAAWLSLRENRPFAARLRTLARDAALLSSFPTIAFLAAFGVPWEFRGAGLLELPALPELLQAWRWYVARDVGWIWTLLGWSGLLIGLRKPETRPVALTITLFIAIGSSYFASMYPGDTPRYLIPTIPFTLFGIGYLLPYASRTAKAAAGAFAAASVAAVLSGIVAPPTHAPAMPEKALTLPMHLAGEAARAFESAAPVMAADAAMAAIIPDDAVVVIPERGTLIERHLNMRPPARRPSVVNVKPHLPADGQLAPLERVPASSAVFAYPGVDRAEVARILAAQGFAPAGAIGGVAIYRRAAP